MKKPGIFLIPLLIFAVISFLGTRLFASGAISPAAMVAIFGGLMILMAFVRPKNKSQSPVDDQLTLLGEPAQDAFKDDEKLQSKFQSAVADYTAGMPRAAMNKLTVLATQCKTDNDRYAIAVMTGLVNCSLGDFENAIKLYNQAIVLFPGSQLAAAIGSAHQRLGELKKAIDSYEFALELDENNLDARSSLATAYVAHGDFELAIEESQQVLDQDENNASALATIAICHGVLGNEDLRVGYTEKAVANGYKEEKINTTIDALKKRHRK